MCVCVCVFLFTAHHEDHLTLLLFCLSLSLSRRPSRATIHHPTQNRTIYRATGVNHACHHHHHHHHFLLLLSLPTGAAAAAGDAGEGDGGGVVADPAPARSTCPNAADGRRRGSCTFPSANAFPASGALSAHGSPAPSRTSAGWSRADSSPRHRATARTRPRCCRNGNRNRRIIVEQDFVC